MSFGLAHLVLMRYKFFFIFYKAVSYHVPFSTGRYSYAFSLLH